MQKRLLTPDYVRSVYTKIFFAYFLGGILLSFAVFALPFRLAALLAFIPMLFGTMYGVPIIPKWICRRCGLSLEREVVSPFQFDAKEVGETEAELRRRVGNYLRYRVNISGPFFIFSAIFFGLHLKRTNLAQSLIPIGVAALAFFMSLSGWYRAVRKSQVARVNSQGLIVKRRKPIAWARIAKVVEVQQFDLFGKPGAKWLQCEDAQGRVLARVPMNNWGIEEESRFRAVVALYLQSPWH